MFDDDANLYMTKKILLLLQEEELVSKMIQHKHEHHNVSSPGAIDYYARHGPTPSHAVSMTLA